MAPVRVFLVDDNLEFLQAELELLCEYFEIVGTATDGKSVLAGVDRCKPDVVVLDVSLGDLTGFDVARQLKSAGSPARIVFLTAHEGEEFVSAALRLGVSGYVCKSQASEDLTRAIRAASCGQTFFPPHPGGI